MRIAIVLGTRPEIIKLSPVVKELERVGADFCIIHTGQHYSHELDRIFFERLKLPQARYNLEVGSGSQAEQTGRILSGVEGILLSEKPDLVLVLGDTNSVLGGALAAAKLHVKVGHIEAGLRSYDRSMPEEVNRILTDHCSDYLFSPTEKSKSILLGEGIPEERVFVTGNTIVDAVYQNIALSRSKSEVATITEFCPTEYFLVTLHRRENVDNRERFDSLLLGLNHVMKHFEQPIIYPMHPHSAQKMVEFGLGSGELSLTGPLDYLDFLQLMADARLILTDSGGVQEEACILGVPCVTLRDNTERLETVDVGANILAGVSPDRIVECVHIMLGKEYDWPNPFGDGTAAKKIVSIIGGLNG